MKAVATGDVSTPGIRARSVAAGLALVGLALTALGFADDPDRTWKMLLLGHLVVAFLGLGAAFVLALQHVLSASWGLGHRRLAEAMTGVLPGSAAVHALLALVGRGRVWAWMEPGRLPPGLARAVAERSWWLNLPGFLVRDVGFLLLVAAAASLWRRWSRAQDRDGDPAWSRRATRLAAVFLVFWAPSICFFAFDALMSLDPTWSSSIFGFEVFSGSFQSAIAALALAAVMLSRRGGSLEGVVGPEALHDLGRFLFGLVLLRTYLGFGQYLIIWYAALPDELRWYAVRTAGGWGWVSLALVAILFAAPFLGLLPRRAKRSRQAIAFWAAWLLAGQILDLYWRVAPAVAFPRPTGPLPGPWDAGPLLLAAGLFLAVFSRLFSAAPPVPARDPRYGTYLHPDP